VSREKVSFLISLHGVMMGEEGLSVLERAQLGAAIREVYANAHEQEVSPRESMLRDVLLARSEQEKTDGAFEIAAVLRNLADRLGEFCDQGAYSYLLDRATNVPKDSPLVVFDTRSCPEVVIGPVMFSIIEYVQRAIARIRAANARPANSTDSPLFPCLILFVIEESWHLLDSKDGGIYVNDLARRARHLGLFLIVISQLLSDFSSEFGLALLRNCTQLMLLKLAPSELAFAQEALQLSQEKCAIVRRLKTVKGSYAEIFWINGTRGQARVTLRLGPTEYWCYTSEPLRDVPAREAMIAEHDGAVWQAIHQLALNSAGRESEQR
jgi:type IV secretory pathway VirB4 component